MQILHPFAGSLQQYTERLADPDCYRPGHCPQCHAKQPLTAHGFYTRTLIDTAFDGIIRVRRYLCQACRRTVSLLPEFILPYLRSSLMVIAMFLIARLLGGQTIEAAAGTAPPPMPYQRGQFWIRRFRAQAASAVRRTGRADSAHSRARLRPSRSHHAPIHRLDRRSSLPVCRRALPPAGLAARSGSRRPPRRILLRRSARLSLPTHHLHGTAKPSAVRCRPGEKATSWTTRPKKSRSFVTG